mmetsp:Transcript_55929/g.107957  ORF Transcript_55929/g.107957 Transcript_55929/m.107957 type:complete len:208 (+) Transcript_55929:330-953(+)
MRWLLSPLATARSTPEEYHVTQHVKSALICSQRGATQPIENRHGLNAATRLVTCHHFRLIAVKALMQHMNGLCKELPLETVQAMHTTLTLCSRAPELEAKLTLVKFSTQLVDGRSSHVLHRVFHAHNQIWHELVQRAFVLHCARHTLGHFYGRRCSEVAVVRAFLHSLDGTHTSVALEAHAALRVKVLAWRLLGACKQAAAHDAART